MPVYATNTSGNSATDTVCNVTGCPLLVAFSSSDRAIAGIDGHDGRIDPQRPGVVTFYATTYAYGVVWQDSLPFIITWPSLLMVQSIWTTPVDSKTPVLAYSPAIAIVSVGAHVAWLTAGKGNDPNPPGDSVDVVFDDPSTVQSSCGVFGVTLYCELFPDDGDGGNIAPFFPDTAALRAGDVLGYYGSLSRARTFPVEGTYTYHSRRYPSATGKIIVTSGL
jgi:plastocyanin